MEIRPLNVEDDTEFTAYHAIRDAAEAYERPWYAQRTVEELRTEMRDEDPGERTVGVVAVDQGEVVGAGVAFLPTSDNLHLAFVTPWVAPDRRRRGIGTKVLDHLVALAAGDQRTELVMETGYPFEHREDHAYRKFAEANGFRLANTEVRRLLELPVDLRLLDSLAAEAAPHHAGYRIESFAGPVPDDLLPSLCDARNRLATDAPMGDLLVEAEAETPEMRRERETTWRAMGREMVTTVAIAADGVVVAYNDLMLMAGGNPYVSQWGTLVVASHRGQRLGMAVKVAGLRRLQQIAGPDRTHVQTCNAEQNAEMVRINERVGFEPVEVAPSFLRRLEPAG